MRIGRVRNCTDGRLLNYFVIEFHIRTENLEFGNCWGWTQAKKYQELIVTNLNMVQGPPLS
jgi:hypothetical protein